MEPNVTCESLEERWKGVRNAWNQRSELDLNTNDILHDLIGIFESSLLQSKDVSIYVYGEALYWLSIPEAFEQVWSWIINNAKIVSVDQRPVMVMAIFEVLLEDPCDLKVLDRLLNVWSDGNLRWILPMAYDHFREQLWFDLDRLAETDHRFWDN